MASRSGQRTTVTAAFFAATALHLLAAPRATWHHSRSPYRAAFEVTAKPNHARAGTAVSVPVCGLAPQDGTDMFAYDDRGSQLPLLPLGNSVNNEAVALVAAKNSSRRVYLYFGSKVRAPVHQKAFIPSLFLDVRTLPEGPKNNWTQVQALLGKSQRLARLRMDQIHLAYNPVDSADACIAVFDGYLNITKKGTYTYMLVSDDSGYLFIDNKPVIARDGRHWARDAVRGEFRKAVQLDAGPHRIRCVVVDFGGQMMAVVARWINGKNKYVLKPEEFVQPGRTKLLAVEARHDDMPMPAFNYKHLSYMSFKGAQYTETKCTAYNGKATEWVFNDGAELKGKSISKIMVGLSTQKVLARQRGQEAMGSITFPEMPPKQLKMGDAASFKRYSELILAQNLGDMKVSTLRGYITFLEYRELNEDMLPIYEAILNQTDDKDSNRPRELLGLARVASGSAPDKAEKAYDLAIRLRVGKAGWEKVAREYAEFVLFRQRDFDAAAKVVKRVGQRLKRGDKTAVSMQLDLALQTGKEDEARKHLDELLSGREIGKNQRYAAVKANALREQVEDLLKAGFLLRAREALWEWEDLAPDDRMTGSLCLARSQLLQKLGWLDGALGELEGAILLNPILPNLPDVELERARIYHKASDRRKGNDILMKIIKDYPNHPAAQQAKELVQ